MCVRLDTRATGAQYINRVWCRSSQTIYLKKKRSEAAVESVDMDLVRQERIR